jgi:hypothetical protein
MDRAAGALRATGRGAVEEQAVAVEASVVAGTVDLRQASSIIS